MAAPDACMPAAAELHRAAVFADEAGRGLLSGLALVWMAFGPDLRLQACAATRCATISRLMRCCLSGSGVAGHNCFNWPPMKSKRT